eukprot:1432050-Pyramimonas_sp.AAC.1
MGGGGASGGLLRPPARSAVPCCSRSRLRGHSEFRGHSAQEDQPATSATPPPACAASTPTA